MPRPELRWPGRTCQAALIPAAQPALSMAPPVGSPSGGPWVMVFEDHFTGTTWDTSTWAPNMIWGPWWRTTKDAGQLAYSPHDGRGMQVSGSVLSLTAAYAGAWPAFQSIDPAVPDPLPSGNQATFTSGLLSSHPRFKMTEGYIEASMAVPYPAVTGSWPAFWSKTLGGLQPEIDFAEWNSSGNTGQMHTGYMDGGATWHNFYQVISDGNFHAWACKITATDFTFYLDGTQYYNVANDGTLPPWHVILDHWIYSAAASGSFPVSVKFDYVRAWTVQGVPAQPSVSSLSPAGGVPTAGSVTVSFPAVPGASSYRASAFYADYYTDSGGSINGPLGLPSMVTGASSPITVTGLTNGYHYNFTVAAVNATGYSIESLPAP